MPGRLPTFLLGALLGGISLQGPPPPAPPAPASPPPPRFVLQAQPVAAPARKLAEQPRGGLGSSYSRDHQRSRTLSF